MRNCGFLFRCIAAFLLLQEFDTTEAGSTSVQKRIERSSPGCPDGWAELAGKCYGFFGFHGGKRDWYDAERECMRKDAKLVSIHSRAEQDFLNQRIMDENPTDTWIGLKDREGRYGVYRDFIWADDSPLDFTSWREGEPSDRSEPCVHLWFREGEFYGKWNDVPCGIIMAYICRKHREGAPQFLSAPTHAEVPIGGSVAFHCDTGNADDFVLMWKKGENQTISTGEVKMFQDERFEIRNKTTLQITGLQPTDSGEYSCVIGTIPPIHLTHTLKVTSLPSPTRRCPNKSEKWIDLGGDVCYLIETEKTFKWMDAVYECYKEGGSLASFHSTEQVKKIVKYLKKGQPLHIGLWKQNDGGFEWVDKSVYNYRNWELESPSDRDERCVEFFTHSGKWNDIQCDRKLGYICSSAKGSSLRTEGKICPDTSSKWADFGSESCYILDTEEEVSWSEARQRCLDEGGSLATFHSIEEVSALLQHNGTWRNSWSSHIGLRQNSEGGLEWVDKSPFDFNYNTERNGDGERCGEMQSSNGFWGLSRCAGNSSYICSTKKVDAGSLPVRPQVSTELPSITICGGEIISDNGTVQSPNYPENYNPKESCLWKIKVPENYQIALDFHVLEVEYGANCEYDYIEIFDHREDDSSVKLCGSAEPQIILSDGNEMAIKFVSDASREDIGYFSTFTKVEQCGGNIVSEEGVIQSRNYPANYLPNDICVWKIFVPEGYNVLLKFQTFELEEKSDCSYDYLEVRDGHDLTSPRLGRFCGSVIPSDILSSGHKITVTFASDYIKEYYGFSAEFSKTTIIAPTSAPTTDHEELLGGSCGGDIISEKGTVLSTNYPGNYFPYQHCTWRITVPRGYHVILRFKTFMLEHGDECQFDYVDVFDGRDPPENSRLGKFCGSRIPETINSTGNEMALVFKTDSSVQYRGFAAVFEKGSTSVEDTKKEVHCGGDLVSDEGVVQSPNYPNNYDPSENCEWRITVPEGNVVALKFTSFKVEIHDTCSYDYVEIRDGGRQVNAVIANLCGYEIPQDIQSSSNKLTIVFKSDSTSQYNGFSAEFKKEIAVLSTNTTAQRPGPCGGDIYTNRGNITSPNYPDDYPELTECTWNIIAPEGQQVILTIRSFSLEYGQNCEFDNLTIFDGAGDQQLQSLCGESSPQTIRSSTNSMIVKFKSDESIESSGFVAIYRTTGEPCGGDIFAEEGLIQSPNHPNKYDPSENCSWNITVPKNYTVTLKFLTFDVPCVDLVRIRDPSTGEGFAHFCGWSLPSIILSLGNRIEVEFRSDASGEGTGFSAEFKKAERCGRDIVADEGTIQSPNYPNDYEPSQRCKWSITVPDDYRVKFTFLSFDVDCNGDKVIVHDGTAAREFCGDDITSSILSSGNTLGVEFFSDGSGVRKGFSAEFVKGICGGNISADSGTISSANYPNNYPSGESCLWMITVPTNYQVVLQFEDFRVEECGGCSCDFVEVLDGHEPGSRQLGKFCGTDLPQEIRSSSEKMAIRFISDSSVQPKGFTSNFRKELVPELELTDLLRQFPSMVEKQKGSNSEHQSESKEHSITRIMRSILKK